jgi:hypothetical protein
MNLGWQQWPDKKPDVPRLDHGWLTPNVKAVLKGFLSEETRLIVELGCWLGRSTRFMLDCAPNARLIAVDHWFGAKGHQGKFAGYLPDLYEKFLVACWGYRDRIEIYRGASTVGMKETWREIQWQFTRKEHGEIPTMGYPDLVYVDAGHDYNSVFCDALYAVSYFPHAQIVGDDWSESSEVRAAVEKVAKLFGRRVGTKAPAWWYEKS